ncbi:hypothetical protein ENTCAN_08660 [Enterobacter cancerogenus ATCC 35316]|nr:hypothetical protein ENTCAN_08660 [Enterobacter cancerogenus ATCC 35316]
MKGQHRHHADFIQNQLIHAFIAAAGRVRFGKRQGGEDQLAQQRGDLHDLTGGWEIGARQRIDKQRAGSNVAGDTQGMRCIRRQPDAAPRWDNPTAGGGVHPHHAAQAVQQLGAVVLMPRLAVAMKVIMRKGNKGAMGKGEGCGCGHGLNNPHPTLSLREREKVH